MTETPTLLDVSKLILNSAFYISSHDGFVVSKGLYPQIMSDVEITSLTCVGIGPFIIMPLKRLTFGRI
jgi:hypothetical protein